MQVDNQSIVINASELNNPEAMRKLVIKNMQSISTDQVVVINDANLSKQEIYAGYMKAMIPNWKETNSDLKKYWENLPANNDGDNKFEMPSTEHRWQTVFFEFQNTPYMYSVQEKKMQKSSKLANNIYNAVDGKIENISQGLTGDCWLLADLLALTKTQEGKKAIKDAIRKNSDGSIDVTFAGISGKNTFRITPDELSNIRNSHLAFNKDCDAYVIEIATRKLIEAHPGLKPEKNKAEPLDLGYSGKLREWLTKDVSINFDPSYLLPNRYLYNAINSKEDLFTLLDFLSKDTGKYSATVSTRKAQNLAQDSSINNSNSSIKNSKMLYDHAYAIQSVDSSSKTVVLLDPQNQKQPITISYEEFYNAFRRINYSKPNQKEKYEKMIKDATNKTKEN